MDFRVRFADIHGNLREGLRDEQSSLSTHLGLASLVAKAKLVVLDPGGVDLVLVLLDMLYCDTVAYITI